MLCCSLVLLVLTAFSFVFIMIRLFLVIELIYLRFKIICKPLIFVWSPKSTFFVSAFYNFHISLCRDEHADRLRSGTWAKDSGGGPESLPEVRRLGQCHQDFGSSEGEKGASVGGSHVGKCCRTNILRAVGQWLTRSRPFVASSGQSRVP